MADDETLDSFPLPSTPAASREHGAPAGAETSGGNTTSLGMKRKASKSPLPTESMPLAPPVQTEVYYYCYYFATFFFFSFFLP